MAEERVNALVDTYWKEWDEALAGLGAGEHERLIAAIGAVDTVWDRHLFEHAETFGGAEIGYARALSAAILGRLLGVDYAALASVAGSEIPLTGDETLDENLATARQEALDTFSADLLGPVKVGDLFVYAKPMLLEIMNDQGEEAELDALSARSRPYEFRAANTGEVFALLALHQTLKERLPEDFRTSSRPIIKALPGYQAAKAYLLSYDQFEDVPLKGVDRTQPPDAEKLLFYRENAPSFGVLLAALSK
jgi:hypothetical protein